ncbi:MAG: ABC transporter permease [Bacteroidales bacterium]|nr:ABC transporter permease [Bacteroidales bacterium]
MTDLIKIELYKVFARKRSYIGFGAIIVIVILVHIAFLWEGEALQQFVLGELTEAFYMQGNLLNGYLVTYLILNFLWLHIPLLVVIVTADLLSGEASAGTYRLILTRPVNRIKLVNVKFLTGIFYTFTLMVFFALVSLGIGLVLFGTGDLVVILHKVSIVPEKDLLEKFLLAFGYGFLGMVTITCMSLMFSAMSNNSLSPILLTMAIIIIFTIVTTFNFTIFETIKPFLLTKYLDTWQTFFQYEYHKPKVIFDSLILIFHSIAFYLITIIYFRKKDILT